MNTVKVGDKFEDKCYRLIERAIKNGELGIDEKYAKVFKKKGYYSKDREKDIVFDLSIEVWPEGAERFVLLFIIECKSSPAGNKVPVDDVEEFCIKINQVAGVNVKGVMITDNSFQKGGLTFAKNKGMMLIEVDNYDNHSIILHRTERKDRKDESEDIETTLFSLIKKTLGFQKVEGLVRLSTENIEEVVRSILMPYNGMISAIKMPEFLDYLETQYEISFDFNSTLEAVNGKKILGYYDVDSKKILIDKDIAQTTRFPFVLGHELGHFFLHSDLKLNQERYNDFADSEYDFFTDKYLLKNDKNWIEWQANKFAVSLFMPQNLFLSHMIAFRKRIGISRPDYIYLDDQPINRKDFRDTLQYLSAYFGISKTSVKYRLNEFDKIIDVSSSKNDVGSIIRREFFE